MLTASQINAAADDAWLNYPGGEGPGKGKKVVLVSGDEEYRSEEGLPELGAILSARHGFECRVVFSINPDGGYIDPTYPKNTPGIDALDSADLMIILTRFRDLPDDQMEHVDKYLKAGKPVIGLRTSTHAFQSKGKWAHYSDNYNGPMAEWKEGFGRLVLGEHWISHHGNHKQESTRGILAPGAEGNPILRGLKAGDIWGSTDVYGVRLPLPGDSKPLVLGQVTKRKGDYDKDDLHYGMRPEDDEPIPGMKNDPMMPVAWTKTYQVPGGAQGKVFATTMGASSDLTSAGTRRMIVNAVYWILGMEDKVPAEGTNVDIVGEYKPSKFEFRSAAYWKNLALTPATARR